MGNKEIYMTTKNIDPIKIAMELLSRDDFEGLRLSPYLCPAGYWTIGYGSRFLLDGKEVTYNTPHITVDEAKNILKKIVISISKELENIVRVPLESYQKGALLSWQYNIGTIAASNSTLIKLLNLKLYKQAGLQILRWDKATINGKLVVLPGLKHRRIIEYNVYNGLIDIL